MSKKIIKHLGASVKQKLLNIAYDTKRPFNEVLQYYMIERFIYRLSLSPYRNSFILKGALMFVVWNLAETRATRDIDLLVKTSNTIENISNVVKTICGIMCEEDAVAFLSESVECEIIQEKNDYHGIRVSFCGELEKMRTNMQIDVGFGDVVFPQPTDLTYPTLLSMPSPSIWGYTPETLIAEKVHAMIHLGLANSRMKDYFDVWFLSHQFNFNSTLLSEALNQTFATRNIIITESGLKILDEIIGDKLKDLQWKAFIAKNPLITAPLTFDSIIKQIHLFINPIFETKKESPMSPLSWQPPGPWQPKEN